MKQKIGIVITKNANNRTEGFLAKTRISGKLDSDGLFRVYEDILKNYFKIDWETKTFEVESGTDIAKAKEIGIDLNKIYYTERLNLKFNEKLYRFDDTPEMYEV